MRPWMLGLLLALVTAGPSSSACAATATAAAVATTSPIASSEMLRTSALRSRRLAKNAAE